MMCVFPLVMGLPVRFTMTVNKKRNIFRYTEGHVAGWTVDPVDVARVENCTDLEIHLEKPPLMIYVQRTGEGMPQHMDLEPEIYGLKLRNADWPVDSIQKQN